MDKSLRRLVFLFVTVLALDQLTKYIARAALETGSPVPVLGDLLRWTLAYNPGGAFGMKIGGPNYYLFTSFIIFLVLLFYVYINRRVTYVAVPLAIVSGGAAGNIIDRFRFGEVIDFIDCEFPDITIGSYSLERWPIFNIADMAVSCGILVTIVLILYHTRGSAQPRPASPTEPVDRDDPPASSDL